MVGSTENPEPYLSVFVPPTSIPMVHDASFAGIAGIVDPTYIDPSDSQVEGGNIEKHSENYRKEGTNDPPVLRSIVVGRCGS